MGVIEMIDTLDANSNIVAVWIRLDSDNKWDSEIVVLIINKYSNMYDIEIWDFNSQVDD